MIVSCLFVNIISPTLARRWLKSNLLVWFYPPTRLRNSSTWSLKDTVFLMVLWVCSRNIRNKLLMSINVTDGCLTAPQTNRLFKSLNLKSENSTMHNWHTVTIGPVCSNISDGLKTLEIGIPGKIYRVKEKNALLFVGFVSRCTHL